MALGNAGKVDIFMSIALPYKPSVEGCLFRESQGAESNISVNSKDVPHLR